MSHFTVLIIGDDIEKQLQPYHQYECTDIDDEYVFNVNKNDEVNEFLNKEIFYGYNSKGEFDYQYYFERANELGYTDIKSGTRLEYFTIKGLTPEEIDKEIIGYHGYEKVGDNWIKKTNPNAKWDWWSIGGRWSGFFKLKDGATGEVGSPGVFGNEAEDGYVDSILKKDLDIEGMRKEEEDLAAKKYDIIYEGTKDTPEPYSWEHVRDVMFIGDIEGARNFYNNQERIKAFRKVTRENEDLFGWFSSYEDYNVSREDYLKTARNSVISTYALVKDSVWYAKGEMGWFGMSNDKVSQDEWNEKINQFFDECPDDTRLTLVDCHI